MSVRKVLDSYAMLAFLENEPGANHVGELIKYASEHEKPLFMSVVNWGEVFYIINRLIGREKAEDVLRTLETLPIDIIPADKDITRVAAEFKVDRKMSYADCFAAAIAKIKKADLVTGDREFTQVENIIRIDWL